MNKTEKYDAIIIGCGPAGYTAAISIAKEGKSVLAVDRSKEHVGGVCLNQGCIPTKALLHKSHIVSLLKINRDSGILFEEKGIDMEKMQKSIATLQGKLRDGIFLLFKKHGVTFLEGEASLAEKNKIIIQTTEGKKEYTTENIVIASGSQPREIESLSFNGKDILSSRDALACKNIPTNLLIVGGGSIGIEFAEVFSSFGSNVTVIEMEKSLLPREDSDIVKFLTMYLKKKGINIFTSSRVIKTESTDDGLNVFLDTPTGEKQLFYNKILVAVGRTPIEIKTEAPGLIQYRDGFIPTDSATKEYSSNIYAIGDVSPGPMLAHKAYMDADTAASAITGKPVKAFDPSFIPRITYSHVEVASIGLTEEQVKEKGIDFKTARQFFKANGRAVASGEDAGLIKIITDEKDGTLLGAHLFGPQAGEMIHVFLTVYGLQGNLKELSRLPFAHPTYSELIKETIEIL